MKFIENAISLSENKRKSKSSSSPCIKMTDQAQHLNGDVNSIKVTVNGNFSPKKHTSHRHPDNIISGDLEAGGTTLGGGRLKFFKGKKIQFLHLYLSVFLNNAPKTEYLLVTESIQ